MINRVLDRMSPRAKHLVVLGILTFAFLLPLRGLLRSQGPPMEEGFMLVFPEEVLGGRIPNRDFLHLYGPGSLWWLAAVFQVFGTRLEVERLAALAQMIAIVAGITTIAGRWGRILALVCGGIALVIIIPPIGLTALAWTGAVGLGVLGVASGTGALRPGLDPTRARRRALGAGALFAAALLFRIDLVVAVGLATLVLWRAYDRDRRRALAGGLGVAVVGYLIHLATAGPADVIRGMVLDPVFHLRGGRGLPIPPSFTELQGFLQKAGDFGREGKLPWPIPTLPASAQIATWFWTLLASVVFLLVVARGRRRRTDGSFRSVTLLTAAWFSVGMLPQALQRADSAHLAWVSCVPFALVPLALRELLERRRGLSWTDRRLNVVAALPVVLFVSFVIPRYILNTYADFSAQTFGRHRYSYLIERDGRRFYYGRSEVAAAAQNELLPAMDRVTRPGDSLIVGTTDLRATPYSDAYLYYLYPELDVGTYYIEMDPGVANAMDSRLPDELEKADVLVLSAVWWDWDEPNDARQRIDNGSNDIVRAQYVCLGQYGRLKDDAPATAQAGITFIYQLWMRKEVAESRALEPGGCEQGLATTPIPPAGPE